jgi:hypothetical protein
MGFFKLLFGAILNFVDKGANYDHNPFTEMPPPLPPPPPPDFVLPDNFVGRWDWIAWVHRELERWMWHDVTAADYVAVVTVVVVLPAVLYSLYCWLSGRDGGSNGNPPGTGGAAAPAAVDPTPKPASPKTPPKGGGSAITRVEIFNTPFFSMRHSTFPPVLLTLVTLSLAVLLAALYFSQPLFADTQPPAALITGTDAETRLFFRHCAHTDWFQSVDWALTDTIEGMAVGFHSSNPTVVIANTLPATVYPGTPLTPTLDSALLQFKGRLYLYDAVNGPWPGFYGYRPGTVSSYVFNLVDYSLGQPRTFRQFAELCGLTLSAFCGYQALAAYLNS